MSAMEILAVSASPFVNNCRIGCCRGRANHYIQTQYKMYRIDLWNTTLGCAHNIARRRIFFYFLYSNVHCIHFELIIACDCHCTSIVIWFRNGFKILLSKMVQIEPKLLIWWKCWKNRDDKDSKGMRAKTIFKYKKRLRKSERDWKWCEKIIAIQLQGYF